MSLYEAKRNRHRNVHGLPSSIDRDHFFKARRLRDPSRRTRPEFRIPVSVSSA
jgi:hypothetical protein